jgi:hypothetical protein
VRLSEVRSAPPQGTDGAERGEYAKWGAIVGVIAGALAGVFVPLYM